MNHVELEAVRARWRRHLEDALPASDHEPYLASHLSPPRAFLFIQPVDPMATAIEFHDAFLDWLAGEHSGGPWSSGWTWGELVLTSNYAALVRDRGDRTWSRYVAIDDGGTLQLGLGRDVGWEWKEERFLSLSATVLRIWMALELFEELRARETLEGPFELSLHVPEAQGLVLGGFGDGWAEPDSGSLDQHRVCREENIRLRKELAGWPEQDGPETLAYVLGRQINRAWGIRGDRFLNRAGERTGEFAHRTGWA